MLHLLLAHPGHELLLHGWISRNKPVVHVLTDGAAHSADARLGATAALLRNLGTRPGAIFGRVSDAGHMLPLRDALRADVEKRSCAF